MDALEQIDAWPVPNVAAGIVLPDASTVSHGKQELPFAWASITKLATALAVMVAVEEGSLDLDQPGGPPGSTVRHLLAHASGLPFQGMDPVAKPGRRGIYSNSGYETLAVLLAGATGMTFEEYLAEAVLQPLGLAATRLEGTAAAGLRGPLSNLLLFARELLHPTVVATETLASMVTVAFPGLDGILPAVGMMRPNDWGLGFELRDGKAPHWTGRRNSPQTYGHFGGSGGFVWVDPVAGLACAALSDRNFGPWALEVWPGLSDAVLEERAVKS